MDLHTQTPICHSAEIGMHDAYNNVWVIIKQLIIIIPGVRFSVLLFLLLTGVRICAQDIDI